MTQCCCAFSSQSYWAKQNILFGKRLLVGRCLKVRCQHRNPQFFLSPCLTPLIQWSGIGGLFSLVSSLLQNYSVFLSLWSRGTWDGPSLEPCEVDSWMMCLIHALLEIVLNPDISRVIGLLIQFLSSQYRACTRDSSIKPRTDVSPQMFLSWKTRLLQS